MKEETIYLQNLELALQMQRAGFDKECAHQAFIDDSAYFDAISILANKIVLKRQSYKGKDFAGMLNLPTLGEIDLPENTFVAKRWLSHKQNFVWVVAVIDAKGGANVVIKNHHEYFKTELEARAHAWIWANQK